MRNTISADSTYTVYVGGTSTSKTNVATISAANTWTIQFMNGETVVNADSTQYNNGAAVTAPTLSDTDSHTFKGWSETENGTTTVDFTDVKATADKTYYAVWQENSTGTADEYTITFLNADGTTFATTTTNNGEVVLPENDPKKEKGTSKLEYGFVGWYTDSDLTAKLGDTVSVATTAYPKFVQIGVYGDANANGVADGTDLVLIKQKMQKGDGYTGNVGNREYVGCITSKGKKAVYGDADGNGSVNGTDLVLIKQKIQKGDNYTGTVGTLMTVVTDN